MAINCYVDIEPLLQSLGRIDVTLKQRNEIEKRKLDVLKEIEGDRCGKQAHGTGFRAVVSDGLP